MNCQAFERWLDEGSPDSESVAAAAHAATCASCARAWRAAVSLERVLAAPSPSAPAGFTDRVMARVRPARSRQVASWSPAPPAMPWWVRAAGDPATVLALGVAALAAWGRDGLWIVATAARSALAGATPPAAIPDLPPATLLGLQVAMATLLVLMAPGLHRLASRGAGRRP